MLQARNAGANPVRSTEARLKMQDAFRRLPHAPCSLPHFSGCSEVADHASFGARSRGFDSLHLDFRFDLVKFAVVVQWENCRFVTGRCEFDSHRQLQQGAGLASHAGQGADTDIHIFVDLIFV